MSESPAPLRLDQAAEPHYLRLLDLICRLAYQERAVKLASGRESNFYVDCRQVVLSAEGHFLTGWLLDYAIQQHCPEVLAVGGMSVGADPLVSATSLTSYLAGRPLDGFYVRKQPKAHGLGRRVEGADHLREGSPVAIVEDVVTSGGSALDAAAQARAAGFRPVRLFSLVDRQEGGREAIEAELPLTALYTAEQIIGRSRA